MYAPKGKLPKINSGYAIRQTKLFLSCSESTYKKCLREE